MTWTEADQQQRVAVGRGLGDGVGADDAGCAAGAVLDDEVLARRVSLSFCTRMRATPSTEPPAGNGTTMLTVREG